MSSLQSPEAPAVTRGTLKQGEVHPVAREALAWVNGLSMERLSVYQEAYSSCAIEGNRLAEVCSDTLGRLMCGEPVGQTYLCALAFNLLQMDMADLELRRSIVDEETHDHRLIGAAEQVVSQADDTGCEGDLTVTSKSAVAELSDAVEAFGLAKEEDGE